MPEESAANSEVGEAETDVRIAGIEVVVEYLDRRVAALAEADAGAGPPPDLEPLERRLAELERAEASSGVKRLERRLEALERLEPERGFEQLEDATGQLVRVVTQLTSIGERLDSVEESLLTQPGIAPLVERLAGSIEDLIERVESGAGASGAIAEALAGRIERLERDSIEARHPAPAPPPRRPADEGERPEPSRPGDERPEPAQARSEARRPAPPAPSPAPPPQPASSEPGRRAGGPRGVGRPDANTVTFEQLRSLGCSVTQAARILGSRGRVGGFDRPEAIDSVPGLPRQLREDLKQRLAFAAGSATSRGGG